MTDRPLWKRVGIRKAENRNEGVESVKDQSSEGGSGNSAKVPAVEIERRVRSSTVSRLQHVAPAQPSNDEQEIFQSSLNKFMEVSLSQIQPPGPLEDKPMRFDLKPIHEVESPQNEAATRARHRTSDQRVRIKLVRLNEKAGLLRQELSLVKEEISGQQLWFQQWMETTLIQKLRNLQRKDCRSQTTQTQKTVGFKNSKQSDQTQISEQNEQLAFPTQSSSKRKSITTRSIVKSQNQQLRDKCSIQNLQLGQQIDLLTIRNQTLQSQLQHLKTSWQLQRQQRQQSRMSQLQNIYTANKTLMKSTIQKYMQEMFEKDHIISSLKAQLGQKTEELTKVQARGSEVKSVSSEMGIGTIYTKKYRELYEKVEVDRLRLRAELDSVMREREELGGELETLRDQSQAVIHQNIQLTHRMQDVQFEFQQKLHDIKSNLNKEFKQKLSEYTREICSLKDQLQQRDRKIEFLDQIIKRCKENQSHANPSLLKQAETTESQEQNYQEEDNYIDTYQQQPTPRILQSIRSLPNKSPTNNLILNLRNTVRQVPRIPQTLQPRYNNPSHNPSSHNPSSHNPSSHNPSLYRPQPQPPSQSKISSGLRITTDRATHDSLLTRAPMTPQMHKYERWKAPRPSGHFQKRSLTEQVETLQNMIQNQLQSSVRRKGY